jgi:hypothetical protein
MTGDKRKVLKNLLIEALTLLRKGVEVLQRAANLL